MVSAALAASLGISALPSVGQAALVRPTEAASRSPLAAYTLIVPRAESASGLIARVVLPSGVGCPRLELTLQGASGPRRTFQVMQPRAAGSTTLNAFGAVLVCEARIPRRALSASVAGRAIPASKPRNIDSIALLGDSGCRIKGESVQACNDPTQWPLSRIARRVASDQPDVVIYLGDFFYREAACPSADVSLCGGSPEPLPGAPFTDSAWGWVADALVPMAPMLQSAPLVVVRGNHELCSRGGNGYFLFFGPTLGSADACAPAPDGVAPVVYSPTTAVDLSIKGGHVLRLVNVDSANGNDSAIDDTIPTLLRPLFEQGAQLASRADEAWLLTHRPIAAVISKEFLPSPPGEATPWTSVTQAYSSYGLLGHFDLMLASHLHLAQAIQIPGLPGQVVLGNAGTTLDPPTGYAVPPYGPLSDASGVTLVPTPPLTPVPPIPTATSLQTWPEFGYAMAIPTPSGWSIDVRDVGGAAFATCSAVGGKITCG